MFGKKKLGKSSMRWIAFATALFVLINSLAVGEIQVSAKEPDAGVTAVGAEGTEGVMEGDTQPGEETKPEGDTQPEEETKPEGDIQPEGETKLEEEAEPEGEVTPEEEAKSEEEAEPKADASSEGVVLVDWSDGDHHESFKQESVKAFTYETDYKLLEGSNEKGYDYSAALTFGIGNPDAPWEKWIAANVNFYEMNARVFQVGYGDFKQWGDSIEGKLDKTKKIHAKVRVTEAGHVTYEVYNTNTPSKKVTVECDLEGYEGGSLGFLSFKTDVEFSNTRYSEDPEEMAEGLTDFKDIGDRGMQIDYGKKTISMDVLGGDHFAMYNGLEAPANAFLMEADVSFTDHAKEDGHKCAGLVFGVAAKDNPSEKWYAANMDSGNPREGDMFRVFEVNTGTQFIDEKIEGDRDKIDLDSPLHLKLEMRPDGNVVYTFGNKGSEDTCSISKKIVGWTGGYVGLVTNDSGAVFSNITFEDRSITLGETVEGLEGWKANLDKTQITKVGDGSWTGTEDGLYGDAEGKGDCFLLTETTGNNFVYSTDVIFDEGVGGAAALIFRSNNDMDKKESYAVNIDAGTHKCKLWRWQKNDALQLIDEKEVEAAADRKYNLKVVAVDSWLLYYVNDKLIASMGDYTLQPGNMGQSTVIKEGYFGLLNWNSKVTFQNTYYKELDDSYNPLLNEIVIEAASGTVEARPQFTPTEPITIQYVKNDVSAVEVHVEKKNDQAEVKVMDDKGNVYAPGTEIPVNLGINWLTITSKVTGKVKDAGADSDIDLDAVLTYRVNVHRLKPDDVYYNEAYRGQYHYSLKEGWANDPNGMVYYKGKYHLFYQYYDGKSWGPMHWAHAVSTDLLHWEEKPIALYPDANGAMFSGCIVVDENNTSGLFDGKTGGLVALITADGNGQRIKLAYSTDEGTTWKKVDEIAADWTDDPLHNGAFRDPKVFRWENKWFMVVAGGPLRIYSSDNLREWKCESTYANLETECPDLYPVQDESGQVKWVLSRGGRFYKIGDLKQDGGNWKFIPDTEYASADGVMNFGRDSYAAMTYYKQDFGTSENPTIPEIVEINWMNTWDDYCNQVAERNGSDFNGTFNLQLKLGVTKDGGKYLLTQTPVEAYEELRAVDKKLEFTKAKVGTDNTLLQGFAGDTYEIVSRFYPKEGTKKVGFRLRTGDAEETLVVYDLITNKVSIDRSHSGIIISNKFAEVNGQQASKNADGSVDLHIFVDKSSVEVFSKDYTVAGADQIFPAPVSRGASVLIEGDEAEADITIYPLESIWTGKVVVDHPQTIGSTMSTVLRIRKGEKIQLKAYVMPVGVSQDITWSVKEGSDFVSVSPDGTVTGKEPGTATVVAASSEDPTVKLEFTIMVKGEEFKTNIEFVNQHGNWHTEDDELKDANEGDNDFYMSKDPVEGDFSMNLDLSFTKGVPNLFFASKSRNPFEDNAYAVQFDNGSHTVRLFRFGQDGDTATGDMGHAINDGNYHHVEIVKSGKTLQVYVDDAERENAPCLTHEYPETAEYYSKAHIGIGLWDGNISIMNLYVTPNVAEVPAEYKVYVVTNVDATLGDVKDQLPSGWSWADDTVRLASFTGVKEKDFGIKYEDQVTGKISYETVTVVFSTINGMTFKDKDGNDISKLAVSSGGTAVPAKEAILSYTVSGETNSTRLTDLQLKYQIGFAKKAKDDVVTYADLNPDTGEVMLTGQKAGNTTLLLKVVSGETIVYENQWKVSAVDSSKKGLADIKVEFYKKAASGSGDEELTAVSYGSGTESSERYDITAPDTSVYLLNKTEGEAKFTYKSSDTSVIKIGKATAAEPKKIPLTLGNAGTAVLTVTADDTLKTTKEYIIQVTNKKADTAESINSISISRKTVTVNKALALSDAVIAVYNGFDGMLKSAELQDVSGMKLEGISAEIITVEDGGNTNEIRFSLPENSTYGGGKAKLKVTIATENSVELTKIFDINVKVANKAPSVTVKQLDKVNTFYKNKPGRFSIGSADGQVADVVLTPVTAGASMTKDTDYTFDSATGVLTINKVPEKTKKLNFSITVAGYKTPVEKKNVTVSTETANLKLSATSGIVYTDSSQMTSTVRLVDKVTGLPVDLGNVTVNITNADNKEYTGKTSGDKLILSVKEAPASKGDKLTLKFTSSEWNDSKEFAFTMKPAQLSKAALQIGQKSLTLYNYKGMAASTETTLTLKGGSELEELFALGNIISIEEKVNNALGASLDKTLKVVYENGKLKVSKNGEGLKKGSYKFTVSLSGASWQKPLKTTLAVKVVDVDMTDKTAAKVKVSTKGSIDVLNRRGTNLVLTPKFTNVSKDAKVTDVKLTGVDAHLFTMIGRTGNQVTVRLRDNVNVITKYQYRVQAAYTVQAGDTVLTLNSDPVKIKLTQKKPKVKVTGENIYSSTRADEKEIRFTLTNSIGASIGADRIELLNGGRDFRYNSASGKLVYNPKGGVARGKSYTLKFAVYPNGCGDNEKPLTVSYKVSIAK